MGEKVVGYVRVSTEGQVREGYSLTYQVEEIERY
ncbi:recombinase family protein, partial [Bacillus cytotoxicus]|nr:recombinase family protein [Bacillus cytotoxicus]MDH2882621.1 recombinase family protein [Bacillus cytotoxicus]